MRQKLKPLIYILIILVNTNIFAQICANTSISSVNTQLTTTEPIYLNSDTFVCIDVQFHIVRNNSGLGGFNPNNLTSVISKLNEAYNPHNFFINKLGFDFIDDSTYLTVDDSLEFNQLITLNKNTNAINIYFVDEILGGLGWSTRPGISSVVDSDFAATHITSHEFGHCFGLRHTHNMSSVPENSSNCDIAGDEVCDTPIDPELSPINMIGCTYIGGGGYFPDTNNIMSFTPANCMEHITIGQEMRMREFMASNSILQQAISANSCSVPVINDYQISGGYDNVTYNSSYSFAVVPADYADSYQWSVVPNSNNNCNNGLLPTISGGNNADTSYTTVLFGSCTGAFRLRCRAINSFGGVYYTDREIYVYQPYVDPSPCIGKLFVSPNPIKNTDNITFKMQYPEIPCDDDNNNKMVPKVINIYNVYGKLIFTDTMSEIYKLNSEQLPNGLFFIKLINGNKVIQTKTIIKP